MLLRLAASYHFEIHCVDSAWVDIQYGNYLPAYLAVWIKYTELKILVIHCNLRLTATLKTYFHIKVCVYATVMFPDAWLLYTRNDHGRMWHVDFQAVFDRKSYSVDPKFLVFIIIYVTGFAKVYHVRTKFILLHRLIATHINYPYTVLSIS